MDTTKTPLALPYLEKCVAWNGRCKPRERWDSQSLGDANDARKNYIAALQAADARDMAPLLVFARS